MPYKPVVVDMALPPSDCVNFLQELDLLRAELDDIRTKYAALLAKLDADAGVADTNYAATAGLAAAKFTQF